MRSVSRLGTAAVAAAVLAVSAVSSSAAGPAASAACSRQDSRGRHRRQSAVPERPAPRLQLRLDVLDRGNGSARRLSGTAGLHVRAGSGRPRRRAGAAVRAHVPHQAGGGLERRDTGERRRLHLHARRDPQPGQRDVEDRLRVRHAGGQGRPEDGHDPLQPAVPQLEDALRVRVSEARSRRARLQPGVAGRDRRSGHACADRFGAIPGLFVDEGTIADGVAQPALVGADWSIPRHGRVSDPPVLKRSD